MSGAREVIPAAGAETNQNLDLSPEFTYNELITELARELERAERPPNSVTARELARATHRHYNICKRLLEKKVSGGELQSGQFLVGGRITTCYWRQDG